MLERFDDPRSKNVGCHVGGIERSKIEIVQ
jgi:catabolite regulation protein CreA